MLVPGPYGYGKTHRLHVRAWGAMRAEPGKRVVYLSAERFTSTFVKALQDKQTAAFKDELRNADLLLIRAKNGQAASGPNDPYDPNHDGKIDVADVRYCQLRLTPQ